MNLAHDVACFGWPLGMFFVSNIGYWRLGLLLILAVFCPSMG